LLASPAAPLQAGIPQKGSAKTKGDCATEHDPCCRKHGCQRIAPYAPILGSAPAMLAPIVLAPTRKPLQETPDADQRLADLKELLEVLDDLAPAGTAKPPAAPPVSSSLEQSLARIDQQLRSLEQSQATLADSLGSSLERLGDTIDAIKMMQMQIEAIQQRLDKIDQP
jgi:hypothetical protein